MIADVPSRRHLLWNLTSKHRRQGPTYAERLCWRYAGSELLSWNCLGRKILDTCGQDLKGSNRPTNTCLALHAVCTPTQSMRTCIGHTHLEPTLSVITKPDEFPVSLNS